jgi:hypothetical protein
MFLEAKPRTSSAYILLSVIEAALHYVTIRKTIEKLDHWKSENV